MEIMTLIVGILIGATVSIFLLRRNTVGTLRVDQSDPDDQPYLFLEMKNDPKDLANKKYIMLKVNIQNYISQK